MQPGRRRLRLRQEARLKHRQIERLQIRNLDVGGFGQCGLLGFGNREVARAFVGHHEIAARRAGCAEYRVPNQRLVTKISQIGRLARLYRKGNAKVRAHSWIVAVCPDRADKTRQRIIARRQRADDDIGFDSILVEIVAAWRPYAGFERKGGKCAAIVFFRIQNDIPHAHIGIVQADREHHITGIGARIIRLAILCLLGEPADGNSESMSTSGRQQKRCYSKCKNMCAVSARCGRCHFQAPHYPGGNCHDAKDIGKVAKAKRSIRQTFAWTIFALDFDLSN